MTAQVFAYFVPETGLPMASGLAAVVGAVLMVGRPALRLIKKGWEIFRKE